MENNTTCNEEEGLPFLTVLWTYTCSHGGLRKDAGGRTNCMLLDESARPKEHCGENLHSMDSTVSVKRVDVGSYIIYIQVPPLTLIIWVNLSKSLKFH